MADYNFIRHLHFFLKERKEAAAVAAAAAAAAAATAAAASVAPSTPNPTFDRMTSSIHQS